MQGEWIETRYGQVSNVCPELKRACSLKTLSRAGSQAYHSVSRPRRACPFLPQPHLHGLDTLWFVRITRIGRGRRWTGAADGGRQALGKLRRSRENNDGDRLGGSGGTGPCSSQAARVSDPGAFAAGRTGLSSRKRRRFVHLKSCQAALLSLTRLSLRGEIWACGEIRQKTSCCFATRNMASVELCTQRLSGARRMLSSGLLKSCRLVLLTFDPDRKDDSEESAEQ